MILQSIFNIKYWKKEKYNKSLFCFFFLNNVCMCVLGLRGAAQENY